MLTPIIRRLLSLHIKHGVQPRVLQHFHKVFAHVRKDHRALCRFHLLESGEKYTQTCGGNIVALCEIQRQALQSLKLTAKKGGQFRRS